MALIETLTEGSVNMTLIVDLVKVLAPVWLMLYFIVYLRPEEPRFLSLPVVGVRKQWAAWAWATIRSYRSTKDWALEGYAKYAKNGQPFVIQSLDRGPLTLIPPQEVKNMYTLPESVLDIRATQQETNQTRWVAWDKEPAEDKFVFDVVRLQVTRNMKLLTPRIATEIEMGFEQWWGLETEWKEVKLWDTCWMIVTGAVNSALCGAPLCRNAKFLKGCQDHSVVIMAGAMIINACPRTLKICSPLIKDRLEKTAKLKADPSFDWTPPKDALQWVIEECYDNGNFKQLTLNNIGFRLLLLNDVSIPSTSFSVQSLILDLFATDPSLGFVETLRKESETVYEEAGREWTYEAVKKLKLVESAIRESMRISPLGSVALPRTVVHRDGISLSKSKLPHGAVVAVPIEPIHFDEGIYPGANSFNAFRFADSEAVHAIIDKLAPRKDGETTDGDRKRSTNLDEAFLGFGIGKHTCPGRFFALTEMKIFLAHMLMNYDIEYLKEKPPLVDYVWLKVPSNSGTIRIRRRAKVVSG
ncbi:hypothetical protein LOZ58_004232 [Ophidiomyces ophidiicola]|nr:hypothetical protein LOZ58_004232 [Ophidiomyces ophidiicola]